MASLNETLNDALLAYARLAQLSPDDYFDQQLVARLNESRTLDPSGLTTYLLLEAQVTAFAERTTFTAKAILADMAGFTARLNEIRTVAERLYHPAAEAEVARFRAALRQRADAVGFADRDGLEAFLADSAALGYTRRDALRSIDTLDAHQFLYGAPADGPLAINHTLFEFWNIASAVGALQRQTLDGVSLCLIRDPAEVLQSFWVVAIKHGEAVTILTDRSTGPHPLHARMSRRPDRALARRAERHRFPYHLLDLEPTTRQVGDSVVEDGLRATPREGLVRLQQQLAPLATLGTLAPDEFAWFVLLVEQIQARYGREHRRLAHLSYTGEMLVRSDALVSGNAALVRAGHYTPLALPALTAEDVTTEATADQWSSAPRGHNAWMLERYAEAVPADVLNPVGAQGAAQLAAAHSETLAVARRDCAGVSRPSFTAIAATDFGTAAHLDRERRWHARKNQAEVVQRLAEQEFARTRAEVVAWCRARLEARRDALALATVRGELILPATVDTGFTIDRTDRREAANGLMRVVATTAQELRTSVLGAYSRIGFTLGTVSDASRTGYRCAVSGEAASVFGLIVPTCGEALAELFDVAPSDLPVGLRHWYDQEPYCGNSILERLDPMDWVLKNPWMALSMRVRVCLSRRTANAIARAHDLPLVPAAARDAG